ncbi:MAG: hypothetical protein ABSH38_14790 [Verrucomicrobiota bacterium]
MTFADARIESARRQANNQAGDNLAFSLITPADAADPFPYGTKITIRRNRTAAGGVSLPGGLPGSGFTSFSGGTIFFVGYRVANLRSGSAQLEKFDYKFAGPWEFFFERLVFQKLWWTWNGSQLVADWRSAVILGLSVYANTTPGAVCPGVAATTLMTISQQVKEIVAYVIAQTTAAYGSPQLQFDGLTNAVDGVNYDLLLAPGPNCLIPDYIAGYAASGQSSGTADARTLLRAPLDAVNDVTCAEALRYMFKWLGYVGSTVAWFDYTTTPPTFKVTTRDQLPSVNVSAT